MSSLLPYRVVKTLASVPAYFLSPVFIRTAYVVDMAVVRRNKNDLIIEQTVSCIDYLVILYSKKLSTLFKGLIL